VAAGYAVSARRSYSDVAKGFAEGRKSVALAAAIEYVHGRIAPSNADYLAAGVIVGVTRVLPLVATLVAMSWLRR
jgi:hypothetical protein